MAARKKGTTRKSAAAGQLSAYRRKRDFDRTTEPSGDTRGSTRRGRRSETPVLQFVIQKHAATQLHFDFRLELDGTMKSWAVPKGPSLDPSVKRLAMEVEDHPLEYNTFEGTIPQGEYGGGTVMLWDRGTYTADEAAGDPVAALRSGYAKGNLKLRLDGERLRGSFVLRRIKPAPKGGSGERAQWLLIKRLDDFTEPGSDVVATFDTSIESGRTMDEIAEGKRVWRSNRPAARTSKSRKAGAARPNGKQSAERRVPDAIASSLAPMLATLGDGVPIAEGWAFEPKYDGIRVLVYATPHVPDAAVTLVTRDLDDTSAQFPEVVEAVGRLANQISRPFVLDGEIVAVDAQGQPARFQALQSRMKATRAGDIAVHASETPAVLYAFDLLLEGEEILIHEPWSARRARLERLLRNRTTPQLRLAASIPSDGEQMLAQAREQGWEGVIAKRMDARYEPGIRSRAWIKLKVESRQEFVVGGWTEPRNTRQHLGALLLGYYDDGDRLVYAGHTGGGLDQETLRLLGERLATLERDTSPFAAPIKTNEPAHWVEPEIVVEVRFNEWTADGKLRQPIFVGIRDDKEAHDVRRERPERGMGRAKTIEQSTATSRKRSRRAVTSARQSAPADLVATLAEIERDGGDGVVLGLDISNLGKIFFPEDGITKGALMRYYAQMAPAVLPVIADRPLVLKRFPNGIHAKSFYQQRAPDVVPDGVRVETVRTDDGEEMARIVGGDLTTLLYIVQLGAISIDPWLSRIQTCDDADVAIIDLDPGPQAPFTRVVEVAQWTKEELDELGLHAAIKTSGATGLHIALPLPIETSYETAQTLAQLVAARVADRHPKAATIRRAVKSRPSDAVYVDYLQNIRGKSVAGAYSVRARPGAPVSTPLDWDELTSDLDPGAFTIDTVPQRVARIGDLWAAAMKSRNTLARLRKVAER